MLGYFEHIYNLPMKFFSTRKTGDIITRFSDAFTIKEIFTNIALTLIMDIGMALATGIILFNMNIIYGNDKDINYKLNKFISNEIK